MEPAVQSADIREFSAARRLGADAAERWEVLYREFGERVFRLAARITGDDEVAADITHDAFLRVAERGAQYAGRGSAGAWVYRIARNLALKHLRRERRWGHPLDFAAWEASWALSTGPPDAELTVVVRAAVARLPEDVRVVLLLHDVDGYTHTEIGEMLAIASGSSRARLSRGRARLREWLRDAL